MAAVSYLIYAGQVLEQVVAGTNPPGEDQVVLTAGAAAIPATHSLTIGEPVVFPAGSNFAAVTGFVAGTIYYVSATGFTQGVTFQLAATPGGASIVPGGAATATVLINAVGAVEIRMDQTAIVLDAQSTTGVRALKKGEIQQLIRVLEEYLIRDVNVLQ